jgi:hypothetical protein
MKKIEDLIGAVVGYSILTGFTLTIFGWVLWSAKWVLSLLGVM